MANVNLSNAFGSAILEGFGGIDQRGSSRGGVGVRDLRNFRISESGALIKRGGFAPAMELPSGRVRAVHTISEHLIFALIDNGLYRIDPLECSCELIKTLAEIDTDACFFNSGSELLLLDGNDVYVYSRSTFELLEGYVPLYGDNWDPIYGGPVNQPLNALSSRVRIRYKITSLPSTSTANFILSHAATSIDRVLLNGTTVLESNYKLGSSAALLLLSKSVAVGDVIEIFFTTGSSILSTQRSTLGKCVRGASFGLTAGGADPSSVALWGGTSASDVYFSRHIKSEDMTKVRSVYTDIRPIYLAVADKISIRDGSEGITAACRSRSDLAIFTPCSAYVLKENSDGVSLAQISGQAGCSVRDGAITLDNTPLTLFRGEVLHWTYDDLHDNRYVASTISLPISELRPYVDDWRLCAFHSSKRELWFVGEDRVWIYGASVKKWFSFDGFYPDTLFELGENMAFISGSTLYVFADDVSFDVGADGYQPIIATIESDMMSFGAPNRKKRLTRAMLSFSAKSGFLLTVTDAEGTPVDAEIRVTENERLGYYETRLPCPRSRFYSFTVTHEDGPFSLYAIALYAVK